MKLKSIKKLCSAVRYEIRVYDENGRFIEYFKIDYVDMSSDELTEVLTNKYFKYENRKVRNIDIRSQTDETDWLVISVEV